MNIKMPDTPHQALRDARLIQADAVRAIAVEAIRTVTGCSDITGNGTSLVEEMERTAHAAARVAVPDEYRRLLSDRDQLAAEVEALRADALRLFDQAVSAELPRVSHIEYDSHEICKHFAEQVRLRIDAARKAQP